MTKKSVLTDILRALVKEWGKEEVAFTLSNLANENDFSNRSDFREQSFRRSRNDLKTAVAQVERAKIVDPVRNQLLDLAHRYDRSEFLPSTSDARELLFMIGIQPGPMKDRSQAFRRLLDALLPLSPEKIEQIARAGRHSGPSRLGPLSDAISDAAKAIVERRGPGNI